MKKLFLTIVATMAFLATMHGQNPPNENEADTVRIRSTSTTNDDVIPPSPRAAAIIKYGEYPVSLYTGLVDITVPIYTIERSGIKVPIEFKYHASGLKYDEVSMEVGLGWTLMAGGVIIQSIRGAKDQEYATFVKDVDKINLCATTYSAPSEDYLPLREVENGSRDRLSRNNSIGCKDGEFDMYSFSFLHYSGNFCFPFSNSETDGRLPPGNGTGLFIPAIGMKAYKGSSTRIELLDTDGIFYVFEHLEYSEKITDYYLTTIISANKADTILFSYDRYSAGAYNYIRKPYINYTCTINTIQNIDHCPSNITSFLPSEVSESGGLYYHELRPPRLKRIDFSGGHIDFEYAVTSNNVANNIPTWDLQKIKIYNLLQSLPLQTIYLTKSKFSNGEQRLDKVTFTDAQMQGYDYQFGYRSDVSDIRYAPGIDYWGYYNGSSAPYQKRYIPKFPNQDKLFYNGIDRSANEHVMQGGVLNKVIYPTKGYSEFTYEAHKARNSYGFNILTCGGLRIKEIKNYLPNGSLAEKKWYKYGESESGTGITNAYPDINDFLTESRTLTTYFNDNGTRYEPSCLIYTKHYLSFPKRNYFISGSSVVYSQVTEYTGNEKEDYGKTIYSYHITKDDFFSSQGGPTYRMNSPDVSLRTYPWKTGKLVSKTSYKKEGNTYIPVYSLYNQYQDINTAEYRNLRVRQYVMFTVQPEYRSSSASDVIRDFCRYSLFRKHFAGNSPYDYYNYYTTTGLQVLSFSEETIDGVKKRTDYDSYNKIGLPTKVRETTSTESGLTFIYKYPTDFTNTVYTSMQSKNMLTPVIEKITYKDDNQFLEKEITNYKFWHSKFYAPENKQIQYQNGSLETRLKYDYGAKGNIGAIIKDDSDKTVYLWGYNHQYPIAEIKGATYAEVKTVLGENLINNIAAKINPDVMDLDTQLRVGFKDKFKDKMVLISTYAYKPLVGMTSKVDPNGITAYYEYDEFNRLKIIRNHEGNVLNRYEYHYAGQ